MVRTRSQVRKNAQPPLPMYISLSNNYSHASQGSPRSDSSKPSSSHYRPQLLHQHAHQQAPQQHTQHTQRVPVQQQLPTGIAQRLSGTPVAHPNPHQPHTQQPRSTTDVTLSVTRSSRSSHRGRNSSSVGSQK
ncbi:hypothetical protein V6N13_001231 [Hibiscus sabdariffa]|uniref:Uncharacterized protein n=1 Tax=Hibiscus sabdariffa TaxID=183260 RepID=A0ABR2G7V0_9ROSI